MPVLPEPQRLSLHDAISYVAKRCKCETQEAGKAVYAALGEDAIRATANRLMRDHDQPVPFREYVDTGLYPVPAKLWAGYPWQKFLRRAVLPRGNPEYREETADGRSVGPVFSKPTIAPADINAWLGSNSGSQKVSADATEEEKGLLGTIYEASEMKVGAFGFKLDLKPILARVRRYRHFR
jgi:hypothetical protein